MTEFRPGPPKVATGPAEAPIRGGAWYFVLTIATAGILTAVPFWHAASRLGRPDVRKLAIVYTLAGVYLVVLAVANPRQPDGSYPSEPLQGLLGASALLVIIAGCFQLRGLRRQVYGSRGAVPVRRDPAVARVSSSSPMQAVRGNLPSPWATRAG